MSKSEDNLKAAFAGESQANRRYLFFANKADAEGHKAIARLFRAAADAETVHARNHLDALKGVKSTPENVKAAVSGEHYEFTEMYPQFITEAEQEGNKEAANTFALANKVEKIHHTLYENALTSLEKGQALTDQPIFVCQVCGNTVWGEAPDKCPVCGAPKKSFKQID
ncbi:MAG: rubrerythrin family protein [Chloroflexi bacterium]|nr:rubrerythrin family protein [Chloroflexota bacterium]